ncbi:imidazole glycerol phosphate synthase subunit HisF [Bradyrhizobium sp. 38]|uniref:AglZ/HisF2 family acetamidino modification protein n=1 Tax=unclassified Bradyrhizobium TaxID=2631580 RepID=UPI001FFBFDCA|nr:imidazole glycerol phosphate synthase subunit HisF [Bradyrhizobium sp. 38]MCK1781862.1 imidazole glycerol phosphate synthase subunit HisF [Bradyrhizobium sp. 132]
MLRPRIIPSLLVQDKGLVKTVGFSNPKYVGDPINVVRIFNEKLVDELAIYDIDATVRGHEPDYLMLENLAVESRMPLCYGGGVKTVDQVKTIIGLGIEKVAISSAAVANPNLIAAAAEAVGSQSVVVVLDVKPRPRSNVYEVWTHNAKVNTGRTMLEVAAVAEKFGAGEIVVNAIERDGQMKGYDLELARQIDAASTVPVTILGGAGSLAHIEELIRNFGVIGIAAGSLFVFKGIYRAVLVNYPTIEDRDRLLQSLVQPA